MSPTSPPLVSTIIPVFNRPRLVTKAVESVLSQTYQSTEVILVDDGSTDETPEVLSRLVSDHPGVVHRIRQDNAGPGVARNAGLRLAQGDFIQYLDSDDLLHPDKFEVQVRALTAVSEADVCYCVTLRRESKSGQLRPWARTNQTIENLFPSFLPKRGWATLTPLWRRHVCDLIGPWKPLRMMEDWEHDLRAGLCNVKAIGVPQALCTVVDHDEHRASGLNDGFTRERTLDLYLAHRSIWNLMRDAGKTDWSYVGDLSRTMFLIARMCGRHQLFEEADEALDLTDQMTSLNQQPSRTTFFRKLRRVFGWTLTVKIAETLKKR
ncbi:glycosyltransferase family 2 protein [Roseiconus lacunae]|uniref:Glycosyltransferase family 2 protein n=1 Tax=Roseiconus lacunae TaxID=2605694 RepID=A0ABT7PQR1_9BACT|nr:glycosyltransferase family 2 protein [Roseiconus lacunae]MDM4018466.1 glycosyltransferase family 2 protein [Roseiconus lacunae]